MTTAHTLTRAEHIGRVEAQYESLAEALRDAFYDADRWSPHADAWLDVQFTIAVLERIADRDGAKSPNGEQLAAVAAALPELHAAERLISEDHRAQLFGAGPARTDAGALRRVRLIRYHLRTATETLHAVFPFEG